MKYLVVVAYAATVILANWFIGHVGITFGPGPHLLEVWPGIYAPSGVLWVAGALTLRNLTQEVLGKRWAAGGILLGAGLSYWVASPALATASALAFAVSESSDMLIWTKLRHRGVLIAQVASNIASDIVDSIVFLAVAFHSLALLSGQIIGKEEITAITVVALSVAGAGRYRRVHTVLVAMAKGE